MNKKSNLELLTERVRVLEAKAERDGAFAFSFLSADNNVLRTHIEKVAETLRSPGTLTVEQILENQRTLDMLVQKRNEINSLVETATKWRESSIADRIARQDLSKELERVWASLYKLSEDTKILAEACLEVNKFRDELRKRTNL